MATLTNLAGSTQSQPYLRKFEAQRDLGPVADLVELCFAETLDPDGYRYLQQMRFAAANPRFMRWTSAATEWAGVPLRGYVWEQDGRIVGNLSLIPFMSRGTRQYLIANVAVHPDYRRRGIARQLTVQALAHVRQRGAPAAWLHVREENQAAQTLYRSVGFEERARRTTWISNLGVRLTSPPAGMVIEPRRRSDWGFQKYWLSRRYPEILNWHLNLNFRTLQPGLIGGLFRLFLQVYDRHWSASREGQLTGVLSWVASPGYADNLWLAAAPEREAETTLALLTHARQNSAARRPMSLDYPAGHAIEAIQEAGFHIHQTLIWMEKVF